MKIEHSAEIDCSPDQLWPFLEEPEKQKLWMKGLLETELTSDPPATVGSTFKMKIKEGRKIADYDGEILTFDVNERMQIKFGGGSFGDSEMFVDYRLLPVGGRTRLDYQASMVPKSLFLKLMSPLFGVFGKMQIKGFIKTLKNLAEQASKQTAGQ